MPPLRTCGVTVLSVIDHSSTDGISTMVFLARANEPSRSQVALIAPSYRTVWLWPPYWSSLLNPDVSVRRRAV